MNLFRLGNAVRHRFGDEAAAAAMPFVDALIILVLVVTNALALAPAVLLVERALAWGAPPLSLALLLPVAYYVYLVAFVVVTALAKRVFAGRLVPGTFRHFSPEAEPWRRTMLLATAHHRFGLVNLRAFTFLKTMYWRALGSRIHHYSVTPFDSDVYEPELVEIGPRSVVGMKATLSGHVTAGAPERLRIDRLRIGSGCLIGGHTVIVCGTTIEDEAVIGLGVVIGADCHIGRGAVIENNSGLRSGTRVGEREVWSGNPATLKRVRPA